MLETFVLPCLLCLLTQADAAGQAAPAPPGHAAGHSPPAAADTPPADAPPDGPATPPSSDAPARPAAEPPTDARRPRRPTPPELVAEALMLPPGHTLTGQPITLASALTGIHGRSEQLEVVRAYWRLVEAVAAYRFQLDYDQGLEAAQAPAGQAARHAAARAASKAQLGEAELDALAAQHALAALAGLPTDSALPLPADRPHVGPYLTRFQELFAYRTAPPAARRLDRTLPLRFQTIEALANAVAAADEASAAVGDPAGGGRWPEQVETLAALQRLRRAWVAAVCRYNDEIAEYALAVAPAGTGGTGLVGLLIRPSREPVRPLASDDASDVRPAEFTEPVRVPMAAPPPAPPAARGEPTPAVRPAPGEPTPARRPADAPVPPETPEPESEPEAGADNGLPPRPVVPIERPEPETQRAADDSPDPAGPVPSPPLPFESDGEVAPLSNEEPAPDPTRETTLRPAAGLPPLYPGLAGMPPGARAKQLGLALHWNRNLPDGTAEPVELLPCLARRTGDRRALIAAYWTVRQRAAAWQVREQHRQWLEELSFAVADDSPETRRLRVARAAAEAASAAAHAELAEAQFHLAEAVGQSSDAVWPMAVTQPHAGDYLLKFDSLPPDLGRSWPLRRLADTVPRLSANLREQATAVVASDAVRAEAEAAWLDGAAPFREVLDALDRQTDHTLAFLATLTAYNQAIADYALRVLPPGTPEGQLVRALVMGE